MKDTTQWWLVATLLLATMIMSSSLDKISDNIEEVLSKAAASQESQPAVKTSVVEVVRRVSLDYGTDGIGVSGFLVRDGDKLDFAPVDDGSRLGRLKPKQILKIVNGTKISYQPLFDLDNVER